VASASADRIASSSCRSVEQIMIAMWQRLFADTALPAFLGAVLAVFAVLAGVTWVSTCAGSGENVERHLTDEQ